MNSVTSKPLLPRWLTVLLTGFAGLALLLVLLIFAALALVASSHERQQLLLEHVASRLLDRQLEIGQLLDSDLGWDTYLLARDVRLSNPSWADNADFVAVGRLGIRINLPSIWRDGPVIIDELDLRDAKVSLLAPATQAPNWEFWPADADVGELELELETADSEAMSFPLLVMQGRIANGEIHYRDPDQDVVITIDSLQLLEPHSSAQIELDLVGAINGIPLEAKGHIGPADALLNLRDLNLDLALNWGQLSIVGRGSIGDLASLSGPDLHIKVAAPHSRPLLDALGMPEVRDGPLQFEAHLTDAQPGLAIRAVGALDEFQLNIEGKLVRPLAADGVDLRFTLNGPSLAEAGAMFELHGLPPLPYQLSGEVHRQDGVLGVRKGLFKAGQGRVAIEGQLPSFPEIDDWNVSIDGGSFNLAMLGPLIGAEGLPEVPYDIKASLSSTDEGVELLDLQITSPDSRLSLNGVVGEGPQYLGSRVDVKLSGANLASTGLWLDIHDLPTLAFQLSGELAFNAGGWQLAEGLFQTPGLKLAASGEIDSLSDSGMLNARIGIDSQNLASTLMMYGFEVAGLPDFPLSVLGVVTGLPRRLEIKETRVSSGASELMIEGMLGDPLSLADLDLTVDFSTPDLLELLPVVAEGPLPTLAVELNGRVAMQGESLGLEDIRGQIGGAQTTLSGQFSLKDPFDNSQLVLAAKGPDLNRVLGPWIEYPVPTAAFELVLDGSLQAQGATLKRLDLRVADVSLSAKVDLDKLDDLATAQGTIKLAGPSSFQLVQMFGVQSVMQDSDYALNIDIHRTPQGLRLDPIALDWGNSDYSGSVAVEFGEVPKLTIDLHTRYMSLPFLMPDLKELEQEEAARIAAGDTFDDAELVEKLTTRELAERVIPNELLDFSWLGKFQGSLKYQVDELYIRDGATTALEIDLSVIDSVLSSRKLSWDGSLSTGDAELTIRALKDTNEIDLYLDLKRIPVLMLLGGDPDPDSNSLYRARFKVRGNSLHEMASSANGALVFRGGGGRLNNVGMGLVLGDMFEEIVSRINPFTETDSYTQMVCHAGAISFKDGHAAVSPGVVLRTDKMDIASGGTIDLHNEKLNLAFSTRSRKGLGVSASKAITPYLKIGGTLANPRLTLDAKGVALSGSAAVATAGLSIVAEGLWDRWVLTARNPCERLISEISKKEKEVYKGLLEPASRSRKGF